MAGILVGVVWLGYIYSGLGLKIDGLSDREKRFIIYYFRRHLTSDISGYMEKGLRRLDKIIVSKPYTTYSWYLVLNLTTHSLISDREAVVYYNSSEPLWTIAGIVYEVIGKAIYSTGILCDHVLPVIAVYKMGLQKLYMEIIRDSMEKILGEHVVHDPLKLLYDVVPKIMAYRLVDIDYNRIISHTLDGDYGLVKLWMNTGPSREEIEVLSVALKTNKLDPIDYGLPDIDVEISTDLTIDTTDLCKMIDGTDQNYCRMLEILLEIAKEPWRAWEILEPWKEEIALIKEHINKYIEIMQGQSKYHSKPGG